MAENLNKNEINVVGVRDDVENNAVIDYVLDEIPGLKVKYKLISKKELFLKQNEHFENVDLTLVEDLFTSESVSSSVFVIYNKLKNNNWPYKV